MIRALGEARQIIGKAWAQSNPRSSRLGTEAGPQHRRRCLNPISAHMSRLADGAQVPPHRSPRLARHFRPANAIDKYVSRPGRKG
jgi:hypothetical protein